MDLAHLNLQLPDLALFKQKIVFECAGALTAGLRIAAFKAGCSGYSGKG
ncbi:MAG: hypothetical protein HC895_03690 [Leptolyngbyaceae cyanobacterium SM1_3_5]|nr:hypothetical protein [Leptolyngbyaceae cyanobacterium SM1_3_5]